LLDEARVAEATDAIAMALIKKVCDVGIVCWLILPAPFVFELLLAFQVEEWFLAWTAHYSASVSDFAGGHQISAT